MLRVVSKESSQRWRPTGSVAKVLQNRPRGFPMSVRSRPELVTRLHTVSQFSFIFQDAIFLVHRSRVWSVTCFSNTASVTSERGVEYGKREQRLEAG